jgi:septal ring factor EnvC (AmiA/AmiB activator)
MVKKSIVKFLSLLILLSIPAFMQEDSLKKKQSELDKLRTEISELEKKFSLQSKKEKESFEAIENFNRQSYLLNKLINKFRAEEKVKQDEISKSRQEIKNLEEQINLLQKNYAKYVVAIYKYGKSDELAGVFDAGSFEQALIRIKYLQRFSEKRENDLKKFYEAKEELIALKKKLESEKREKALLANEKQKEETGLKQKLGEKKKLLTLVKNNKAELKKELDSKKKAEVQIRNLITKLIEEAERKREEERLAKLKPGEKIKDESSPTYDVDLSTYGFETFSSLKGRLNWPISSGKIIRQFGENRNVKLNTVTMNYGVDIKVSGDLSVKSVAGGVVSAIDYIPGYGSVIILTHRGDYRTVYSHLSEIYVNEGDKLKAGSLIARVGESFEGYILHFEIWSSRNNQNPELWLAKR